MRRILLCVVLCSCLVTHASAQHEHHMKPDNGLTVAVFLGVDCPISQKYIGTLNDLYARYPSDVHWQFIIPGETKSRDIKQFAREFNVQFPLETENAELPLTTQFGATVTPQAIVVVNGEQIYSGAIDNWFYALGKYRSRVTEHYLVDAIDAGLKGKKPRVEKTEPIGCFIQGAGANAHHHEM